MVLNNPLELPPGFQSRIITFLVGNPIYKSSFCHWNPGWGGRYVDPNNPSQRPPTASHPGTSHRKSHGPPYPRSAGTWQCRAHRRHRTTQSSLGGKIRLESIFRLESAAFFGLLLFLVSCLQYYGYKTALVDANVD